MLVRKNQLKLRLGLTDLPFLKAHFNVIAGEDFRRNTPILIRLNKLFKLPHRYNPGITVVASLVWRSDLNDSELLEKTLVNTVNISLLVQKRVVELPCLEQAQNQPLKKGPF